MARILVADDEAGLREFITDTLEPQAQVEGKTLVAVAAFVGKTRLIDNIVLEPEPL